MLININPRRVKYTLLNDYDSLLWGNLRYSVLYLPVELRSKHQVAIRQNSRRERRH